MKIVAGLREPDDGHLVIEPHTRIAYLPQTVPEDIEGTLLDVVLSGADASAQRLAEYERLSQHLSDPPTERELERLQDLQDEWTVVTAGPYGKTDWLRWLGSSLTLQSVSSDSPGVESANAF